MKILVEVNEYTEVEPLLLNKLHIIRSDFFRMLEDRLNDEEKSMLAIELIMTIKELKGDEEE